MTNTDYNISFRILEFTDTFVRGRIDLSSMEDIYFDIYDEVETIEFEEGVIGTEEDGDEPDHAIRQSKIAWLTKSHVAKSLVNKLVSMVNDEFFELDISDDPVEYQYTVYSNYFDHYDWHQDHFDGDESTTNYRRTLSLSLCLTGSDLYEGAELFVKDGDDDLNIRVFKMGFGEFVIFPSETEHRVNALREGERTSLVIWYGYNQ